MKIAIVGTAAFSRGTAPYDDPSWYIIGHGYWSTTVKRYDAWLELHDLTNAENIPGQVVNTNFLTDTKKPLYIQAPHPLAPNGKVFPIEKIKKMGVRNLTGTTAMAMAWAIMEMRPTLERTKKPQDWLGLWGVEMIERGEWELQRAGVMHFLDVCDLLNIQIMLPEGSDLLSHPKIYAYDKETGSERKVREYLDVARQDLLDRKTSEIENQVNIGVAQGQITILEMVERGSLNG